MYSMHNINPILLSDSYKLSHINFTSKGVKVIYSNFTPRFTTHLEERFPEFDGKIVWYGILAALKQIMIESWENNFFKKNKEEVIKEARDILEPYIGMTDFKHFEALHDLGYMPIEVQALAEGSLVSKGTPCLTIKNTHEDYQWLPNYLETILTAQLWKVMTVATIARMFKITSEKYALKTTGTIEGTEFQTHDFSLRGHSGYESGGACGSAFLLSSSGSDNIPALQYIRSYYNTDIVKNPVAFSISSGEHSVTTLGIQIHSKDHQDLDEDRKLVMGEHDYLQYVLQQFPAGFVAYVADSYDYFTFLTEILPLAKDSIMARDGRLVIRGDSGDPVDIIAGIKIPDYSEESSINEAAQSAFLKEFNLSGENSDLVEAKFYYNKLCYKVVYDVYYDSRGLLDSWKKRSLGEHSLTPEEKGSIEILHDIFGGTVNELGYKVLDTHIGMVYGDGITVQRATEIFERLEAKGFASTNIIFGVGSFSLAFLSRDDLGIAVKATAAIVQSGEGSVTIPVYKEPKTDTSKKSAKGFLKVTYDEDTGLYTLQDNVTEEESYQGELKTLFLNGNFTNEVTFQEIKNKLYPSL